MSKNLFDFADENFEEEKSFNKQEKQSASNNKFKRDKFQDEDKVNQAKNIYNKYKDMSQKDLIEEFVSTSKQKINQGSISKEKINQTANMLSPYLNEQQKLLLNSLMEKLND